MTKRLADFSYPTGDSVFKRIMHEPDIRNDFLSAVLHCNIVSTEIMPESLHDVDPTEPLQELLHNKEAREQLVAASQGTISVKSSKKREMPKVAETVAKLTSAADLLSHLLPDPLRHTQLDLLCKTSTEIINVEIQVIPQNYWDIRVLDHGCALFHKQFPAGLAWSSLEDSDTDTDTDKPRRVVCISLLVKPPVDAKKVQACIPWYRMTAWDKHEVIRHIALMDIQKHTLEMGGLEFIHLNLNALTTATQNEKDELVNDERLRLWLDYWACAHDKTKAEVDMISNGPLRRAYQLLEYERMDTATRRAVVTAENDREGITSYVQEMYDQGVAAGRAEGVAQGQALALYNLIQSNCVARDTVLASASADVRALLQTLLDEDAKEADDTKGTAADAGGVAGTEVDDD